MKSVKLNLKNTNDYYTREAFKVLRTNIQFCGTDIKVICFTSCESNEGKTYICVELARAMAEAGIKVLLIDTDMRKSVMASRYSAEKGIVGLSQYLSGMVERDDIIYTAENVGFDLVFAGIFPPNPVELLGSKRFKKFIEDEKNNYDYILIDTPPVGIVIDGAVVTANCDGAVIVVSIGMMSYRFVQQVKEQIEKSGCHSKIYKGQHKGCRHAHFN
jgi:capsular exopolysaccharide synthesis family protein